MDSNFPDYMMDNIDEEEYMRSVHERFAEYYSIFEEENPDENSEEYLDKYYDIYNEKYSCHFKIKDDSRVELKVDGYEYDEEYFTNLSESYSDDIGDLLASGHTSIESLAGGYEHDVWIKERKAYIDAKISLEVSTAEKLAEEKKNRDFNEYINGGNPEGYIPSEYAIKIREDWDRIYNEIDF